MHNLEEMTRINQLLDFRNVRVSGATQCGPAATVEEITCCHITAVQSATPSTNYKK